jgi:DNA-binding transcriptional LysR family regulator
MDRFQEMTAFVAVVETGGFSAAARRLGESQSAVSKAVGALETRLGVALLHRSTRSVTLTDHGRTYYARTVLLEEMAQTDAELQYVPGTRRPGQAGHLRYLRPPARAAAGAAAAQAPSRHPARPAVCRWRARDLLADGIDLAIRVSPQQHPDAVVKRVASTSLVCVGARSYFRRHGLPRRPRTWHATTA